MGGFSYEVGEFWGSKTIFRYHLSETGTFSSPSATIFAIAVTNGGMSLSINIINCGRPSPIVIINDGIRICDMPFSIGITNDGTSFCHIIYDGPPFLLSASIGPTSKLAECSLL
jgi:hypothetical protein